MNLTKAAYQLRNWRAHLRALTQGTSVKVLNLLAADSSYVKLEGRLNAAIIYPDKKVELGCISRRVVTTAFVNYLRDDLANAAGGADISTFRFHGCGTGAAAESIADTALGAECTTALNPDSTRSVGTQVNAVAKTYTTVATFVFDAAASITEHCVFNAASGGIAMDRSVFAAIPADATLGIEFTYSLTIGDGG